MATMEVCHTFSYHRLFEIDVPPCSFNSSLSSSNGLTSPNIEFRVPDEDYDSHSDVSREESVQILDSHARSYYVPSSDDDHSSDEEGEEGEEEGEISFSKPERNHSDRDPALSTPAILESQNAGATPNQPIQLWNEPTPQKELDLLGPNRSNLCDRLGKGDNMGTSHCNPIDLEGLSPQEVITLPNDSENVVLTKILTKMNAAPCNQSTSAVHPTSVVETSINDRTTTEQDSVAEDLDEHESIGHNSDSNSDSDTDEDGDVESDGFHSQSTSSDMRMTDSLQGKSIGNSTDDFDSVDEDDFEGDEFFPTDHNNYSERSSENGPAHRELHTNFSQFKPHVTYDSEVDSAVEHLRNNKITSTPGSMNRVSCSENIINVGHENYSGIHRAAQRPPSPSDAALAKKANAMGLPKPDWSFAVPSPSFPSAHEYTKHRELPQKPDSVRAEVGSVDFNPMHSARDFFDGYDPEWPHYGDDRFANRMHRDNPASLQHCSQRLNPFLADHFSREYPNIAPWISTTCPFSNARCPEYRDSPNAKDEIADSHAVVPVQIAQKEPESHSSRLNIADIVNPHADLSGVLKRKADEMSSDENGDQTIEEPQFSMSGTCEDVLPDAQPRENPVNGEASLFEASENLPKTPLQKLIESPANSELIGHPKKKIKTASSTAINMGKFVSGVCVGVVGVVAAFIATIPMNVQEEALQEIAKPL